MHLIHFAVKHKATESRGKKKYILLTELTICCTCTVHMQFTETGLDLQPKTFINSDVCCLEMNHKQDLVIISVFFQYIKKKKVDIHSLEAKLGPAFWGFSFYILSPYMSGSQLSSSNHIYSTTRELVFALGQTTQQI